MVGAIVGVVDGIVVMVGSRVGDTDGVGVGPGVGLGVGYDGNSGEITVSATLELPRRERTMEFSFGHISCGGAPADPRRDR